MDNDWQVFVAYDHHLLRVPEGFTTCDSCTVIVWAGPLANETVVAPGQTMSQDGRGQWQGAITCAHCTLITLMAFQALGGRCPDCNMTFKPEHQCNNDDYEMVTEDQRSTADNYFWQERDKMLDGEWVVLERREIENHIELQVVK